MPLFKHDYLPPEGELGLWTITEKEDFFLSKLELHPEEQAQLDKIKGRRRTEWLASRFLVHSMSGRSTRGALLKDEFGKPHLENSYYDISISHSHDLAAAIAAPCSVGIDIQRLVEKIERIAHKFMRTEEFDSLETATRLEHLHVYWGAKEALYKAYGRRQLDFKEHILIEPFTFNADKISFKGKIVKDEFEADYILHFEQLNDYILVYALEDVIDVRLV